MIHGRRCAKVALHAGDTIPEDLHIVGVLTDLEQGAHFVFLTGPDLPMHMQWHPVPRFPSMEAFVAARAMAFHGSEMVCD